MLNGYNKEKMLKIMKKLMSRYVSAVMCGYDGGPHMQINLNVIFKNLFNDRYRSNDQWNSDMELMFSIYKRAYANDRYYTCCISQIEYYYKKCLNKIFISYDELVLALYKSTEKFFNSFYLIFPEFINTSQYLINNQYNVQMNQDSVSRNQYNVNVNHYNFNLSQDFVNRNQYYMNGNNHNISTNQYYANGNQYNFSENRFYTGGNQYSMNGCGCYTGGCQHGVPADGSTSMNQYNSNGGGFIPNACLTNNNMSFPTKQGSFFGITQNMLDFDHNSHKSSAFLFDINGSGGANFAQKFDHESADVDLDFDRKISNPLSIVMTQSHEINGDDCVPLSLSGEVTKEILCNDSCEDSDVELHCDQINSDTKTYVTSNNDNLRRREIISEKINKLFKKTYIYGVLNIIQRYDPKLRVNEKSTVSVYDLSETTINELSKFLDRI